MSIKKSNMFTWILIFGGLAFVFILYHTTTDSHLRMKSNPLPSTIRSELKGLDSRGNVSIRPDSRGNVSIRPDSRKNESVTPNSSGNESITRLYLTEKEISIGNNNNDSLSWPSGLHSVVEFPSNKSSYSLGDELRITIRMYNGYGKQRTRGGDYLRLSMKNMNLNASVSGKVIDHNNGTYTGIVKAVWPGSAVIDVMIARKREELAYFYTLYREHHVLWNVYAQFRDGNVTESTLCSYVPLTGDRELCNLTERNYGFPWYCFKPKNTNLTCDMQKMSRSTGPKFDVKTLLSFNDKSKWSDKERYLPQLKVSIDGQSSHMKPPSVSCSKVSPEVTWQRRNPDGFLNNDTWQSTWCTDTMLHTRQAYIQCLKNKTLWLHGDSTSALFYDELSRMFFNAVYRRGHNKQRDYLRHYNLSISWRPHELPFYHGDFAYTISSNEAQHVLLDSLANNTQDIVVLYLYVHFTLSHPDAFRQHVRRLVQSATKLLERAPNVTIAVRGPHTYYYSLFYHSTILSYWGLLYIDILREEFYSLQKRVVYFDFWDLTAVRPLSNFHPTENTVTLMVRKMMSLICFRENM